MIKLNKTTEYKDLIKRASQILIDKNITRKDWRDCKILFCGKVENKVIKAEIKFSNSVSIDGGWLITGIEYVNDLLLSYNILLLSEKAKTAIIKNLNLEDGINIL